MPEGFVCEALYHGYRGVEGSQSPASIAELVEDVIINKGGNAEENKNWSISRVQVQLDDERLRFVPVRRDEGFESDSEGSAGSVCEETCCNSNEIKVIHDHVMRLDKLLRQDSTSEVGSSRHTCPNNHFSNNNQVFQNTTDSNSISSDDSAVVKKGSEDNTLSSSGAESEDDSSPRLQRATHHNSGLIPAEISPSESNHSSLSLAADIKTVHNNSDNSQGVDIFLMSDIIFCHICGPRPKVIVFVVKAAIGSSLLRAHIIECFTQQYAKTLYSHYYKVSNQYKLNRYRNSKRRCDFKRELAVFPIDPENSLSDKYDSSSDVFNSIRKSATRKDSGNSSVSESGSIRGSIRSLKSRDSINNQDKNINVIEIKSTGDVDESKPFSLVQHTDSNGITHIEIESGPVSLMSGGAVTSDYSSIISLSTPETNGIVSALGGMKNKFIEGSSCPNSLIFERELSSPYENEKRFRQRQPALLLRDEMEIFDYKHSRKSSDESNDLRSRKERYFDENSKSSRESARPPIPPSPSFRIPPERPSRSREVSRLRESREWDSLSKTKHNKGPAPLPPARKHPNDSNVLLVPTKSGHEPKKSYYPKESHIVRGNKVVRVDFPSVPVWNHRADPNNNARHYLHYTGGWSHEYHAPRIREPSIRSDVRRRSRSKSPARRQITNRYLDAVTFNFSQKLKEISDVVFSGKKMNYSNGLLNLPPLTGRSNQRTGSSSANLIDPENLRPVIKKDNQRTSENENRRVTFNAYATVQLMES